MARERLHCVERMKRLAARLRSNRHKTGLSGGVMNQVRVGKLSAFTDLPPLRARTKSGRWIVLQASWVSGDDRSVIAVIIQEATPEELAPIVMSAHGLTEHERAVSALVFRGQSTFAMAHELNIGEHTVQDHLKSIFDKTGVRSRRDLVATVFRQRYLPRMKAGEPRSASGYFVEPDRRLR